MYKRVLIFSVSITGSIEFLLVPATLAGTGWVGYVYWFGWHRHLFFQDLVKEHKSLLSASGLEGLPLQVLPELGDTGLCLICRGNPSRGLALDMLQSFSVFLKGWVPDDAGIFQAGPYKCNVGKALAILGTTSETPAYESELLMDLAICCQCGGTKTFLGRVVLLGISPGRLSPILFCKTGKGRACITWHLLSLKSVLGQVSDRDAPHRPLTRNATRVKKGGRNYTFCPILMKNRGRIHMFLIFAKI